ncbi:MAG: hypothetical protein AAF573_06045 [Bacteroidota bacterium]
MVNDFAFSRIFLVSERSEIFQKLSSHSFSSSALFVFDDWRSCFQKMYQQPEVIFFDWENDSSEGAAFIDKMMTFNVNIPIICIKENNNFTEYNYLDKPNIFYCINSNDLVLPTIELLLKQILLTIHLQNRILQLETQLELKSTIEKSMDPQSKSSSTASHFLEQDLTFEGFKSQIIHHHLKKFDNDITMVANQLDIGRSTIYRMLKAEKEKKNRDMSWFY